MIQPSLSHPEEISRRVAEAQKVASDDAIMRACVRSTQKVIYHKGHEGHEGATEAAPSDFVCFVLFVVKSFFGAQGAPTISMQPENND